jgi:hypothetical protein
MSSGNQDLKLAAGILIAAIIVLGALIIDPAFGSVRKKTALNETFTEDYEETTSSTSTTTTSTTTSSSSTTRFATTTSTTSTTTSTYDTHYIECFYNTDCGENGTWVTKEYTCYEGDIYRQYVSYRCSSPGTQYAKCVGKENLDLVKKCGYNEGCIDGEPYCEYTGDVEPVKARWIPQNATSINLNAESEPAYAGYRFALLYVVSENSQPRGIMIHVQKPDGSESWEYLKVDKGTSVDNLTLGISEMSKTESWIGARIWLTGKRA